MLGSIIYVSHDEPGENGSAPPGGRLTVILLIRPLGNCTLSLSRSPKGEDVPTPLPKAAPSNWIYLSTSTPGFRIVSNVPGLIRNAANLWYAGVVETDGGTAVSHATRPHYWTIFSPTIAASRSIMVSGIRFSS